MIAPASYYDPARFRVDTTIRIAPREALETFYREWKLHHPLQPEQLKFGGRTAKVVRSSMYHGGDILYELQDVPGIWHERCLEAV